MATSKLQALWNHPAGPKTIHFWAPTFKWGISIANLADSTKPPEKVSYPQQIADFHGTDFFIAMIILVQLLQQPELFGHATALLLPLHDYFNEEQAVVAKE
ncbi:hypothetical protein DH2020_008859 [Rehmannia glutinosa]|uniref:Mitochondrial pyruvate carrier n=1 Tax=Rehmannia glutinosa TaxID=99300 RepID=A0ABR0X4N2_REHGL